MTAGYSATGVSFINTTGGAIDIRDVKMTGYDYETYEGGSIVVQQLNADGTGKYGTMLEWWDDADGTGWYDPSINDWVAEGAVMLAPGTGLWLEANSEKEKLVSAGEVITKGADVTLRPGQTLVCNPIPTAITFDNAVGEGKFIAAIGYNKETYEGGSIVIQQLNADGSGKYGTMLEWWDDQDGTGWYDPSVNDWVSGLSLEPGVAIWTTANSTDEKISFPAL